MAKYASVKSKIERTWTFTEKTVVMTKVIAAVLHFTDSEVIENIIASKCEFLRILAEYLGVRRENAGRKLDDEPDSTATVRKTIAITRENYDVFRLYAEKTSTRESVLVEEFVSEILTKIFDAYPSTYAKMECGDKVRRGIMDGSDGMLLMTQVYEGCLSRGTKSDLQEYLSKLKQTHPLI